MQRLILLCLAPLFLLKLCGAEDGVEDIPCTCTPAGRDTQCSVPESNVAGCDVQWTDERGVVMADGEGADKRVLRKSNQTLLTRGCSSLVHYICTCFIEGIKRKATCNFNCSTEVPTRKENERPDWVVPVSVSVGVALALVVLVALVICGIISYKKKYIPVNGRSDEEEQHL